jgi:hypothetical protein
MDLQPFADLWTFPGTAGASAQPLTKKRPLISTRLDP